MTYNLKKSQGFAILYAVLMVSILLTISLTLLDISYKQLVLSSINKESKLAYYATVSALSCANYWEKTKFYSDNPFGYFDYSTDPPSFVSVTDKDISCGENTILAVDIDREDSEELTDGVSIFQVDFGGPDDPYAEVKVIRDKDADGIPFTLILVDGYNTINGPRRVQRSLDSR